MGVGVNVCGKRTRRFVDPINMIRETIIRVHVRPFGARFSIICLIISLTTPFYGFFLFLRDALRQHHARGGTLEEMVAFVGQLPANDKQTMLEVAGAEMVQLRAVELHRLDPEILDPAIDGVILGRQEPDDLLAQIRCPIHLLAAEAEFGGAMDTQDVQHFITSAPHCSYAVLKGAGHGIHEERRTEYLQALQQFMAAVVT